MDSIGAEVGQKMRSAIKAKLLELNCYVDDELPDYIMVMVANKRTKSQMKDDLQLFLTNKTVPFVDWLHIVLKKLKEVTVTNPEIYKKATSKRKSSEDYSTLPIDVKKEKKVDKKLIKSEPDSTTINNNNNEDDEATTFKSLTDDLPINANKLSKQRKIVVMKENQQSNNSYDNKKDNFDIPLLSEVNMSNEEELEMIERKIKNVKTRLGLNIDNNDDDDDYINLKAEPDELFGDELKTNRTIQIIDNIKLNQTNDQQDTINKPTRTRITFNEDELNDKTKKPSILDRLGKRRSDNVKESSNYNKRTRISFNSDKTKESVLNRLGVMSKISIPQKSQQQLQEPQKQQSQEDDEENLLKTRDVPSVVKIKPRVIPNEVVQPNKNLLLKAVADAQRSIAQAPKVGVNAIKRDALFTKRYKEKTTRKLPEIQKEKLKKMLESTDDKEIPQYIPTPIDKIQQTNNEIKQQFIITLDGIEKTKFKVLIDDKNDHQNIKPSIKSRLDTKKTPSPIIFDKSTPTTTTIATITTPTTITSTKSIIPDRLPIIHPPPSIKNKERCKYWPQCRQGDKCEFVHPTINCELFPNCKFGGDKCLYLHPICKFGSSCTRRDCLYSHHHIIKTICKYYPNCTNVACQFYHPKLCKFGKNCKNQDCSFSHDFTTTRNSLVWKPKF